MLRFTIGVLTLISPTPGFAGVILLSEFRSVTASYHGTGTETIISNGTFGSFEASAVGTPFGGGSMTAYQKSNITPDGFTIQHNVVDFYGPGGWAESRFTVDFRLLEDTRITIDGYCNFFSGFASLTSGSQLIPLIWGPDAFYRNYLTFDQVLGPGLYTFTTWEIPREAVSTRIDFRATSAPPVSTVPEDTSTLSLIAMGAALCACHAARGRRRLTSPRPRVSRPESVLL